ncbi:MAG: polysaccharide deacetylase family protein [Candidatus Binatia bacterium]
MRKWLLTVGWRLPFLRVLSSRQPVILLYHGVPAWGDGSDIDANIFERHIAFLKKHFDLVSLEDVSTKRRALARIRLTLTFDDGFRNNAEVVAPILRKYQVPARFFICTRHTSPGKYLWFSYLRALETHFRWKRFRFRGETIDVTPHQRQQSIRRLSEILLNLTPHPAAMYQAIDEELPRLEDFVDSRNIADRYAGMTTEHIAELAADPLFSLGIHTLDHPFLTRCTGEEARRQIQENRAWIKRVSQQPCRTIAYPSGDYHAGTVQWCQDLGLSHGYAVLSQNNAGSRLEIPRMGIYSTSTDILGFKAQWGNLMRKLQIKVG